MVGKDGGKAKPLKQAKAKKNELDEVRAPRFGGGLGFGGETSWLPAVGGKSGTDGWHM